MADPPENRHSSPVEAPDGTKYRVVAAKKGLPFREVTDAGASSLNPLEWVLSWLLGIFIDVALNWRVDNSSTWKIGVIRVGRLREKFVHKEFLASGVDPRPRMDELVDSIAQGHRG
jgi:hypothetical protein